MPRMSQYKAAMERMQSGGSGNKEASGDNDDELEAHESSSSAPPRRRAILLHSFIVCIESNVSFILMPVLPLLWCLLLVLALDRSALISSWGMPLLGIASATLANSVPVGGGVIFVPVLHMFGVHIQLGTAFAVATMSFGNGVFGFLNWVRKSPESIAWEMMPSAIIPAWIGSAIGTLRPLMSPEHCRTLFALFLLKVSVLVCRGLYIGSKNIKAGEPFAITRNSTLLDEGSVHAFKESTMRYWTTRAIASTCSFLAGLGLVAHIGVGNAVVSFLVASYVWKLPAKESVVTSIICGGWTSFCPFLLHLLILKDVPLSLFVMGLPGVYLGANIAPYMHERIGIVNVLTMFVILLLLMAVIMVS